MPQLPAHLHGQMSGLSGKGGSRQIRHMISSLCSDLPESVFNLTFINLASLP